MLLEETQGTGSSVGGNELCRYATFTGAVLLIAHDSFVVSNVTVVLYIQLMIMFYVILYVDRCVSKYLEAQQKIGVVLQEANEAQAQQQQQMMAMNQALAAKK